MNKRRVVITGGGVCSTLGDNWDEILTSLKAYENKVVRMDDWDRYGAGMNTRLAAPYTKELRKFDRKKIRSMGRVSRLALQATDDALRMAGYIDAEGNVSEELSNGRCGISYGSCMGSMDANMELCHMMEHDDCSKMNATTYVRAMPQTHASNLSVYYKIRGRIITTCTACTSGSQSIGYSYEQIAYGFQDVMVAGGAEELSAADSDIFDTLFAASCKNDAPKTSPCPWSVNRDGLVIGEGAGTLILEEYEHAKARGAKIIAEVIGFGTNQDGDHITTPNQHTMAKAIELAVADAGISPDEIGYVNAHGTSTPHGDIAESCATESVFKRPVPISSTKSYTGHTLGACGAIEAWVTINMMKEGWFHPTLNLSPEVLDQECGKLDYIMGEGREIKTDIVMSNNFAFGGVNTSLIFKNIAE
ncbi:MAG: beta-ketoacyl-ACP synthase [Treponema sp.]|nr:beta-ketoacyl-ACP synthase [Treponema sp.]